MTRVGDDKGALVLPDTFRIGNQNGTLSEARCHAYRDARRLAPAHLAPSRSAAHHVLRRLADDRWLASAWTSQSVNTLDWVVPPDHSRRGPGDGVQLRRRSSRRASAARRNHRVGWSVARGGGGTISTTPTTKTTAQVDFINYFRHWRWPAAGDAR